MAFFFFTIHLIPLSKNAGKIVLNTVPPGYFDHVSPHLPGFLAVSKACVFALSSNPCSASYLLKLINIEL